MVNTVFIKFLPNTWRRKILHLYLTRVSAQYIEGTAEGGQLLRKLYPRHIYDTVRRDMAIELGGKEIAKILDSENNKELRRIRKAVGDMYYDREDSYAPVHDFWSFVEMVLHIKKKELPELITAENVQWSVKELPLADLELNWMPFLEQNQAIFGKKPWKVSKLQRIFSNSPQLLQEAKQDQVEIVGPRQHKFDQSKEPIAVVRRGKGYEIIDGNGRLYHAILAKRTTISCYVGIMKGKMPINYWVSSGSLKQLCLEVRGYVGTDAQGFINGINYVKTKLRNNSTALINFELYLRDDFPEFESELEDILPRRTI